ncbi:DUF922 domain-containing protein [Spongiivirga citrea]|uniref:DUF922 domain-containing protein n=1 Tax=Spongiivirga citrea TaxID=1481457 RepID=A0A6M0CIM2_9FLAO|nr:DUF922 domain-containing protein [Spongiivirga citrea]NER17741.1 DUF922 domain-containing protein [Spongiivirga citrea]
MKKYLAIVFIVGMLFSFHNVVAQEENTIRWSAKYRLTWDDFQGKPDVNSSPAAVTASGIDHGFSASLTGNKVEYDSTVQCYFIPSKSWYKKKLADENLLAHEQLHFDIAELHARILRKRIVSYKFTPNIKKEMNTLYANVVKQLQEFQANYDKATNYSIDEHQQKLWQEKVAMLLKKYSDYQLR